MTEKEELVVEAIKAGLGTKEFLEGLKKENLTMMLEAVRVRDSKIAAKEKVIASSPKEEANKNVTTVQDLVRKQKIKSN